MKQFIIENAPWIFSGVGVAMIVGVVRLILSWRKKVHNLTPNHVPSQNITSGHGSTNIQTGSASTVLITANHSTTDALLTHDIHPINIDDTDCVIHKTRIIEGDFQEFNWRTKIGGGIGDVHENIKIILKFIFSCTSLRFPL
jgi:hypothetical protein